MIKPMDQNKSQLAIGVRAFVRYAVENDVPLEACLQRTGLAPADLADPGSLISAHQEYLVLQNIRKHMKDPACGLLFSSKVDRNPSRMGIYGYAMMSAPTLRQALKLAIDCSRLTGTTYNYTMHEHGDIASMYIQPRYDFAECTQLRSDFEVGEACAQFCALFNDEPIPYSKVYLMHDGEGGRERYEPYFGCEVEFDAPFNRIDFPSEVLEARLHQSDRDAFEVCSERCLRKVEDLASRRAEVSYRLMVIAEQHHFSLSAEVAAKALNMSERTLRRKLQKEGACFKDVLADCRMKAALNLLDGTDFLIEEIAHRLHFSSQSAFSHAFKRWTGISPLKYRA